MWNIHVPCNHMSGICISFYSRASHDRWCEIFLFFLVVCLLRAEEEGNTGGFCGVEGHDQLII